MSARQHEDARHQAAVRTYYETNDEALLGPILERVRPRLLDFVSAHLNVGSTAQAEDLVQDTVAKVLQELRARKFAHHGSLTSYALTVCRHLFYAQLEIKKNGITRPGPDEDPFLLLPASAAVPAELLPISAEDEAQAGAVVEAATRAVLGLDPNARAVVVLHYYQGLSVEDAAAQLGIEARKARERLHRGLATLRQWGNHNRHLAPTADVYTALPRLDSGDLFQDHGLRLAS